MAIFGIPMASRPSHQTCRVVVTVEWPDGRVEFKRWRGPSKRAIRAATQVVYKGAKIQLGTALWTASWGAH